MVTLLSMFTFGIGLCRFRWTRFWFAFVVATFRCAGSPVPRFPIFMLPSSHTLRYLCPQSRLGI